MKRVLDGDATYYLGDTYEQDIPATGASQTTIHFTHSGMTVGSSIDGTLWVTAADHLGSSNITRNTAGTTSQQRYTPHGTRRGGGGNTLPVDRTYTGQTDDPGTGLIDYNARNYDPTLGRFTQPDTILDGLNRYTYVHNNPLNHTDPSGHCVNDLQVGDGYVTYVPMRGSECFAGDSSSNRQTDGNGRYRADAEDRYYAYTRIPRKTLLIPGVRQGAAARLENFVWGIEQGSSLLAAGCAAFAWTGAGLACAGAADVVQLVQRPQGQSSPVAGIGVANVLETQDT